MIINADDFGKNSDTNAAILAAFEKDLCNSTSIMANMPGFEEACCLAQSKNLVGVVGIHFVLTEGLPLTDAIKKYPRFCSDAGVFHGQRRRHFRLSRHERQAVLEELRAQARKCRFHGLSISHADSHHHVHEEWGYCRA